jgi:hypothetical protein
MSAFIVEDKVINDIVGFIHTKAMGDNCDFRWMIRPFVKEGYLISQTDGARQLAEDMYKLNCNAIGQRYSEKAIKEFSPAGFTYRHTFQPNIYQVIKSIRCFIYQCSEGDINEETQPLYKALHELSMSLCYHIVSRSPEYEACNW